MNMYMVSLLDSDLYLSHPYLISFGPDNSGCWLSCDFHIQTKLIARYYNDGVLGDHVSSGVQVDLWRIWLMYNTQERDSVQTWVCDMNYTHD